MNQTNLMSKLYVGYVVEAIYDAGVPTLDLRVRIPTLHGASSQLGVKDEDLPIAKPLITPGTVIDINNFTNMLANLKTVYVFFEFGDTSRPVYFGLRSETSIIGYPIINLTDYINRAYAETITALANQTYTITHGLATTDINVSLVDLSDNSFVETDIQVIDANSISVSFGDMSASKSIRVIVKG